MFALVPFEEAPQGEPKIYKVYVQVSEGVSSNYFKDKTSIGQKSFKENDFYVT